MTGGTVLAGLLIAAMAALSVLHAYWGFGGVWPGTDAASLAQTVVGTRGGRMPVLGPSLFVAACLAAVAILIAWRAGLVPGFRPAIMAVGRRL